MLTLTVPQMKQAEWLADQSGISYSQLMENAGRAAFDYLYTRQNPQGKACVILAGSGNNGGDGFVVARYLRMAGEDPLTVLAGGEPQTPLAAENLNRLKGVGGRIVSAKAHPEEALLQLSQAGFVIDALFGTGFHGSLPEQAAALIQAANNVRAFRIALDIPSGLDAGSGEASGCCFQADASLAFGALKPAHSHPEGRRFCGECRVLDIGIPDFLLRSARQSPVLINEELAGSLLPRRAPDSHKGCYGRLLTLAGSGRMCGAAMMCTLAALRSGAGLVTLAAPANTAGRIAPFLMEATTLPLPEDGEGAVSAEAIPMIAQALPVMTAVTAGCGLTASPGARAVIQFLLGEAECPLVLDADGLNCLCEAPAVLDQLRQTPVLTPHPGEMARLTGSTPEQVTEDPAFTAQKFARDHRAVVVLKGHRTLIAGPGGELFENTTGNAGLAKGGSGDVLAGMIGALCAQGLPPLSAAACGVFLHGLAADLLSRRMSQYSMLARDVIETLPLAFFQLER